MYKLHTIAGLFIRLADGAHFPESDDCPAYLQCKAWRAEGNTPAPADDPDMKSAAKARILEIEAIQIKETARFIREETLKDAEEKALAEFGLDPAALYAMGEGDGAPPPAMAYRRLKDIDNAIKAEREKFA